MSFDLLMNDSCTILRRTVSTGKTDTEDWAHHQTIRCRILKQTITPRSTNNTQRSTMIRTRFALPNTAEISIRDRIQHKGREYDVVEVTETLEGSGRHFHTVAVCEGIGGPV